MKQHPVLLLSLSLCLLLPGCTAQAGEASVFPSPSGEVFASPPASSAPEAEPAASDAGLDLAGHDENLSGEDAARFADFRPVLGGGEPFFTDGMPTDDPGQLTQTTMGEFLAETFTRQMELPQLPVVSDLTLCDLDGDGEKELVLAFFDPVGTHLILHKGEDRTLGTVRYIRQIQQLQTNGIYCGSGGAATQYWMRLSFGEDAIREEVLAYEDGWDPHQYWIADVEVTQEEYERWCGENLTGDQSWY